MSGKIFVRCWGMGKARHRHIHQEANPTSETCHKCGRPWRYYIRLHHGGQSYWISGDDRGARIPGYDQAEQLISAIRYEIKRGPFDPSRYVRRRQKEFSFNQIMNLYVEQMKELSRLEGRPRPYYVDETSRILRNIWAPLVGPHTDIRDIRPSHIEGWRLDLSRRYAPGSTRLFLQKLHALMTWTHRLQMIETVPVWPVVRGRQDISPWLAEMDQEKVLSAIPVWHQPIFRFMFCYGVRPSEACGLEWRDVDFQARTVTIQRRIDRYGNTGPTKTERVRVLALRTDIFQGIPRSIGPVYRTQRGEPYRPPRLGEIWRVACHKVGLVGVTLNQGTRHSAASRWVRDGASLTDVQFTLGHTDPRTTMRYAHPSLESSQRIIGKVMGIKEKENEIYAD